jgi:predicted HicB family RNase H-like nuclease
MEHPDDTVKVLNLRLDEPLHRQLTMEAKRSVRSLNGEMVYRLRKSFEDQTPEPNEPAS